jgi:iron complex outermembrane receptor protein
VKANRTVAVLAAAAGVSGVVQPVTAEEVITVTARRVEENLQEVPIAVSTFSDRDMARRGMNNLVDIAAFTPGLSFEDFSGPLETPVIRGQTQTRVQNPVQNVSTFIDGMYLQRSYMIDIGVIGLERVEVVKGPQSALYGQNSFAGAINYLPKKPTESLEADVMVDFGSDDFRMGSVSVAGPLFTDWLLGRFTWGRQQFDGTWNNAHPLAGAGIDPGTEDKLGGYDNETIAANLTIQPLDNLALELGYYRNDLFQESMPAFTRLGRDGVGFFGFYDQNTLNCSSTPVNGPPFLGSGNGLWCGEFPTTTPPGGGDGGDIIRDPRTYGQESTNDLFTARLTWNISDTWEAVYLFGYADSEVRGAGQNIPDAIQGSGNPNSLLNLVPGLVPIGTTVGELEARQHELRVNIVPGGFWEASVGLFYYESDDLSSSPAYFVPPLDATPIPDLPTPVAAFTTREDETTAIFARLGLNFLDGRLRASVEGRYSVEDKSIATVGDPGTARSDSFEFFTPRVTLDYALTENNLLYLSVAQGAKSGGFNDPHDRHAPVPIDPSQNTFDEEKNWTYEIGSQERVAGWASRD